MDLQMTENGALEVRLQLQGDEVWGKTRRSFESGALGRTGGRSGCKWISRQWHWRGQAEGATSRQVE